MSGHSKWSKVKHQKAINDVVKSSLFTKASRAITVSVSEGGGLTDPNMNFHLRLAIDKAREINMPKENILRAIAKAAGAGGATYERILFEGYGPFAVALLIETMTDNRNRTVSAIKNVLEHAGGSLSAPGAVNFLFKKLGVILIPKEKLNFDIVMNLALTLGADDVVELDDQFEFYTAPDKLSEITLAFTKQGIGIESTQVVMLPRNPLQLVESQINKIESLVDSLTQVDDVQDVVTNLA